MAVRHGTAEWHGARTMSCEYTAGHGITPGKAILTSLPQSGPPTEFGTLTLSDGITTVVLPDCKIKTARSKFDGSGFIWTLEIEDRRWRWAFGEIDGTYNQLDKRGKLIRWTVRSPKELAELCLKAMGERNYIIDMPPGITQKVGEKLNIPAGASNPPPGENLPPTGTNPPINWEAIPPAQALSQLCDMFGRRIVFQPIQNRVVIAVPGHGQELPGGSISRISPSVEAPERPDGVGVVGAPTRYQMRLLLDAVGLEWDGSYRPIDMLSYKPPGKEGKQTSVTTVSNWVTGNSMRATINGVLFINQVDATSTAELASLAAQINASEDPKVKGIVKATSNATTLTVTSAQDGGWFDYQSVVTGPDAPPMTFAAETEQAGTPPGWSLCFPPLFIGVVETPRLSYLQARDLAARSVFKCFRVANCDVDLTNGPISIKVPEWGPNAVKRRQQIVLQDTQVEQVVPEAGDEKLRDLRDPRVPFILNLYDGYSRDKPAAVYGSVANFARGGALYTNNIGPNTAAGSQVLVPFSVDPEEQVITFGDYVYAWDGVGSGLRSVGRAISQALGNTLTETDSVRPFSRIKAPDLILQTGILYRYASTNELDRYYTVQGFKNGYDLARVQWRLYEDVQENIIGEYSEENVLTGSRVLEADAEVRARYYRNGMEANLRPGIALTQEYNGIEGIDLDGAISQVSWEMGGEGCFTIASRNNEHQLWIAPYPARRRAENLGAVERITDTANPSLIRSALVAGNAVAKGTL